MKVILSQPAAWDREKGIRPIVRDMDGDFVAEGFYDQNCNRRLEMLVEQSNRYAILKQQMTILAQTNPDMKSFYETFFHDAALDASPQAVEAEFLARKHGWKEDKGQIYRELATPDAEGQSAEYANDWLEAAELVREAKQYYLVRVEGDIEPEIYQGPVSIYDQIVTTARELREDSDEDGLYCLTMDSSQNLELFSFSGAKLSACLDGEDEESPSL